MIIRFEVGNFRSFREPTTLLLTAGRERKHRERLRRHPCFSVPLLPVAVIYGANASGKTNLIEAIGFLKALVVAGVGPGLGIRRQAFKLDPSMAAQLTTFTIDFVALNDQVFRYRIALSDREVIEEELVEIRKTSEDVLFLRKGGKIELTGLLKTADTERKAFLKFTAEGTRPNQPFLAEARQRAVRELAPVIHYFESALATIGPDSRPIILEEVVATSGGFRDFLLERLKSADMGIQDILLDEKPLDEVDDLPPDLKESLKDLGPNEVRLIRTGKRQGARFLASLKDGDIRVSTLRIAHAGPDGSRVVFNLDEESDGTLRYIDLSLAFHALGVRNSGHVFVVDELDRSLHPNLAREAIEAFLAVCGPESKAQLIVTTHDATLMTQDLFRRDEIWFTEKTVDGSTALHSLGEFKDLRYDTELERNYLTGRLGGVPIIQHLSLSDKVVEAICQRGSL